MPLVCCGYPLLLLVQVTVAKVLLLPGVQALARAALLVLALLVARAGQVVCGWLPSRDDSRQISVMCHDIVPIVVVPHHVERMASQLLGWRSPASSIRTLLGTHHPSPGRV